MIVFVPGLMAVASSLTRDAVAEYGTLIGLFIVGFLNQFNAYQQKKHTTFVARKLTESEAVKLQSSASNSHKLDHISDVSREIHSLVNSAMAEQMRTNMLLTQRLAMLTKDTSDVDAAAESLARYSAHMAEQAVLDCAVKHECEAAEKLLSHSERLKRLLAIRKENPERPPVPGS